MNLTHDAERARAGNGENPSRRSFLRWTTIAAAGIATPHRLLADTRTAGGPIIDVHLHAYPAEMLLPAAAKNPVTGLPSQVRNGADHLTACLQVMRRYNVVKGVVSGGDGDRIRAALDWRDRDPLRVIAGAGIRGSVDTPLPSIETLRTEFSRGRLAVLGEITAQYAGTNLSDARYDPYLALAEEFDVPVAVHLGTMPGGTTFDPCCRAARARFGHPETVEEALNRHPRLRLNLMHGAWPYIEETMGLLMDYDNINVDTGAISWLLPRAQFHEYLKQMTQAGFGKRIMFGTDNMFWPDAIGLAIEAVQSAAFLTEGQRRDIFYNNAAGFLRIGQNRP